MKTDQFERPEGFQEHHRRKGDRQSDVRGAETILVDAETHKWIEEHPAEARKLGWSVSRSEDPLDVPIVIPRAPKKERKPRAKVEPKERKVTAVRTPADEVNVIPELIEANVEKHAETMGWQEDVPDYFVIVLALVKLLELNVGDEQEELDADDV